MFPRRGGFVYYTIFTATQSPTTRHSIFARGLRLGGPGPANPLRRRYWDNGRLARCSGTTGTTGVSPVDIQNRARAPCTLPRRPCLPARTPGTWANAWHRPQPPQTRQPLHKRQPSSSSCSYLLCVCRQKCSENYGKMVRPKIQNILNTCAADCGGARRPAEPPRWQTGNALLPRLSPAFRCSSPLRCVDFLLQCREAGADRGEIAERAAGIVDGFVHFLLPIAFQEQI